MLARFAPFKIVFVGNDYVVSEVQFDSANKCWAGITIFDRNRTILKTMYDCSELLDKFEFNSTF